MLGDTLTITLGGSGGTARVCSKINQDSYSAEYLNKTATDQIVVKVRHQKESLKAGESYAKERHNITVTQTVFATASAEEIFREVSFTIRSRSNDTTASVTDVGEAVAYWLTSSNLDKLNQWES